MFVEGILKHCIEVRIMYVWSVLVFHVKVLACEVVTGLRYFTRCQCFKVQKLVGDCNLVMDQHNVILATVEGTSEYSTRCL